MTYKFKNEYRPGDWPVDCAICGSRVWFSDTVVLDPYSGRGNMRVCPDDVDPIDYGLVPYSARPEQPIPYGVVLEPNPIPGSIYASSDGYEILNPFINYINIPIQQLNLAPIKTSVLFTIQQGGAL